MRTFYVFDCGTLVGHVCRVPTAPLAHLVAVALTYWTGRMHDYWRTPEGF